MLLLLTLSVFWYKLKAVSIMNKITVESGSFADEHGRERIFYGVNIGGKNLPLSKQPHSADFKESQRRNIKYLKEHGINLVRYFVNWSYIEPRPKQYNEEALKEIENFLDLCLENDIYVYLDMHQDLYSSFIEIKNPKTFVSYGDGAPLWACLTNGKKYRKPLLVWAEGYFFNKAVQNSFDNFWNNAVVEGQGLQEHFCDLWRMMARRFSNHPALWGFDIFNEPYPGTDGGKVFFTIAKSALKTVLTGKGISRKAILKAFFTKNPVANVLKQVNSKLVDRVTSPAVKYIKKFDTEKYSPFLNKVAGAIREETQNGIILMENSYYSNIGIEFSSPPITVNGKAEKNQAFSPHAYDMMVDTPLYKFADDERVGAIFAKRRNEQQKRLGIPVIVGEWGGFDPKNTAAAHAEFLLNLFDSCKWSHTYWCFNDNTPHSPVMKILCRTHPVAVCGKIENYRYDKIENSFILSYLQEQEYNVPTEIFCHDVPKQIITDGRYEIEKLSDRCCSLRVYTEPGKNIIVIKYKEV